MWKRYTICKKPSSDPTILIEGQHNAFSEIMNNSPEPIGLETNSSLQDGSKSEISNLGSDVLNLKKDRTKIVKELDFSKNVTYTFQ